MHVSCATRALRPRASCTRRSRVGRLRPPTRPPRAGEWKRRAFHSPSLVRLVSAPRPRDVPTRPEALPTGKWKPSTGKWKPSTGKSKPSTGRWKPSTRQRSTFQWKGATRNWEVEWKVRARAMRTTREAPNVGWRLPLGQGFPRHANGCCCCCCCVTLDSVDPKALGSARAADGDRRGWAGARALQGPQRRVREPGAPGSTTRPHDCLPRLPDRRRELMRQLSLRRCTVGQQLKVAAVIAFELFSNAPPTGDRLVRSPVGGAFALGAPGTLSRGRARSRSHFF